MTAAGGSALPSQPHTSPCPGCGADLPVIDGAPHPYGGASSACWTRFAELGATLPQGTPLRRLVTDAYMVQHPGVPERRAIQSVGVHLVALCLVLEHGVAPDSLSRTIQGMLLRPPAFRWLEPPHPNGSTTIVDLEAAAAAGAAGPAIDAFVRGTWDAWLDWHPTIEGWVRDAGLG